MQELKQRNQESEEDEVGQCYSVGQHSHYTQINQSQQAKSLEQRPNQLPNDSQSVAKIQTQQMRWGSYRISHTIQRCSFGEIVLAERTQTQQEVTTGKYVIKSLQSKFWKDLSPKQQLNRQSKLLHSVHSNFIIKVVDQFLEQQYIYKVMEWAPGGDCYSLIKEKSNRVQDFKEAGETAVRFILGCVILGMESLHLNRIIYRNLVPQNVLISQNGYAKLSNFDYAKQISREEKLYEMVGVALYMAPQMTLREGYQQLVDTWSIGVLAFELCNYHQPFSIAQLIDQKKVKQIVKKAQTNRDWKNPHISQQLKDFINSLLRFQPKERLGSRCWEQIKEHKFFSCVSFDWSSLSNMTMKSPLLPIIEKHKVEYKLYVKRQKNIKYSNSK